MYTFGVRYLCVNPTRLFQLKAEYVHNSKETGRAKRTPMERRKHGNRTKLKIVSIWGAGKQNRWELNETEQNRTGDGMERNGENDGTWRA